MSAFPHTENLWPFLKAVDQVLNSQTFLLRAPRDPAASYAKVEDEIAELIRSGTIFRESLHDDWEGCLDIDHVSEPAYYPDPAPGDSPLRDVTLREIESYLREMIEPSTGKRFYSPYDKTEDVHDAFDLVNKFLKAVVPNDAEASFHHVSLGFFQTCCREGEGPRDFFAGLSLDTCTVFRDEKCVHMLLTNGGA